MTKAIFISHGEYEVTRHELCIGEDNVRRLNAFFNAGQSRDDRERTEHWERFRLGKEIEFTRDSVVFRTDVGRGFDECYAGNFFPVYRKVSLKRKLKEFVGRKARLLPTNPLETLQMIWGEHGALRARDVLGQGGRLTRSKLLAAHYFNRLHSHIKDWEPGRVVLEIGPGSGLLLRHLRERLGARVIVVDLPDILVFSFLSLIHANPNMTYLLPHEIKDGDGSLPECDALFLTDRQVGFIPDRCVDLAINTASFGEMFPEDVQDYFLLLRRILVEDNLFYCVNRVEKWMRRPGSSEDGGIPVRFHEYPWKEGDKDYIFNISRYHGPFTRQPFFERLVRLDTRERV